MEKFLLNLLIPVLTFAIGVEIYKISSSNLSIQAISDYTSFYDGMNVQIETYAQLASYDERQRGTVKDDCQTNVGDEAKISFGCCFGRTITIKAQEVIQLEPVEDYTLPE